jgi:hypothetical protein
VVKVTMNLIVYPGLESDDNVINVVNFNLSSDSIELTTKLNVKATVFRIYLKITLSKCLKTKSILKRSLK